MVVVFYHYSNRPYDLHLTPSQRMLSLDWAMPILPPPRSVIVNYHNLTPPTWSEKVAALKPILTATAIFHLVKIRNEANLRAWCREIRDFDSREVSLYWL